MRQAGFEHRDLETAAVAAGFVGLVFYDGRFVATLGPGVPMRVIKLL